MRAHIITDGTDGGFGNPSRYVVASSSSSPSGCRRGRTSLPGVEDRHTATGRLALDQISGLPSPLRNTPQTTMSREHVRAPRGGERVRAPRGILGLNQRRPRRSNLPRIQSSRVHSWGIPKGSMARTHSPLRGAMRA